MSKVSKSTWDQIKTAYSSGIGLREIARSMGMPPGTVLSRAKREGWTQLLNQSKALALAEPCIISPAEAVAEILADDSRQTKRSLSRATRRMAFEAEEAPLDQAGHVLSVTKAASLLHGWEGKQGCVDHTLNVISQIRIEIE